jgi:hypothetical protein
MPANGDAEAGAGAAPGLFGDLQGEAVEDHDVVLADGALLFVTEDVLEVCGAEGDEGAGGVAGGVGELRVVVSDEPIAHVGVGRRDRRDARHAQLVDEPTLQGAVQALAAAARLGGIAGNVFDAEAAQRPPQLRGAREIDLAAGGGGVEGPAGAVGVQGNRQPVGLEDRAQGAHDGLSRLAGPELRVEQPLGGIVDDGDERLALGGP